MYPSSRKGLSYLFSRNQKSTGGRLVSFNCQLDRAWTQLEGVIQNYLDAELYAKKVFSDRQKDEVFGIERCFSLYNYRSCRSLEFTSQESHRAAPGDLMPSSCL